VSPAIQLKWKDQRRKHPHYLVKLTYADKEQFGRVSTDRQKAVKFASRQQKSPVVKTISIEKLS
jgi:hypothetical protein